MELRLTRKERRLMPAVLIEELPRSEFVPAAAALPTPADIESAIYRYAEAALDRGQTRLAVDLKKQADALSPNLNRVTIQRP